MNISLDDYIREKKNNIEMNVSLDEYIFMNNIKQPARLNNQNDESSSGLSKFDRYKNQEDDDDQEEVDDDGYPKVMPMLVPCVMKEMAAKKSVHERLGKRDSICESIHTSQMQLFRPKKKVFKAKGFQSIQNRLDRNYVNPAVVERNRIGLHAINTWTGQKMESVEDVQNQLLNRLNALAKAITNVSAPEPQPEKKYDMQIQKAISYLQGKELYYTCPGGELVVSNDGPGLRGQAKIPTHNTGISLNQRFA